MREPFLHGRGVYLIWRMSFASYLRYWAANFLAPVTEPVFYLIAFGFGFGKLVPTVTFGGQSVPYGEFLAPGMIGVGILFQAFIEGSYTTYKRVFIDSNWNAFLTAPLSFQDVYTGELLWAATKGFIAGVTTGIVAACFGYMTLLDVVQLTPVMFLGGVVFAALGMGSAAVAQQISQVSIPMHMTIVPMFAFCGTYVPRDLLPSGLREVCDFLPLSPLVDLLRLKFLHTDAIVTSTLVLLGWSALCIVFSYQKLNRRVYQ